MVQKPQIIKKNLQFPKHHFDECGHNINIGLSNSNCFLHPFN